MSDTASTYISPNYIIDSFTSKLDGKSEGSYIYASIYNKLASAITATQNHIQGVSGVWTANIPITYNIFSHGSATLTINNPSYGSPGEPPFLPLSTNATVSATAATGTMCTELFFGIKNYTFTNSEALTYGWYERKNNVKSPEGPTPVYILLVKNGESYRDVNFNPRVMDVTPFPASGSWYTRVSTWNYQIPRCIIGSSRASAMATQLKNDGQVYYGLIPTGSTGVVQSDKKVLGPGALMIGGTLWIPPDESNDPLTSDGSYLRKRFASYPTANSSPGYARLPAMTYISHVLIIGEEN